MEFNNILKLIDRVSDSELSRFVLEEGDTRITLESVPFPEEGSQVKAQEIAEVKPENQVKAKMTTNGLKEENVQSIDSKEQQPAGQKDHSTDEKIVKSPLVGVFYNAPSPDAECFVKVGDRVKKGQTLGIIEAMKLMNEIESDYDGIIKEILIENEAVAEYGQPLFVIGQ